MTWCSPNTILCCARRNRNKEVTPAERVRVSKPEPKCATRWHPAGLGCLVLVLTQAFYFSVDAQESFSPYVDDRGGISMPIDYRIGWAFLGTWSVSAGEDIASNKLLHHVYTLRDVVEAYNRDGEFPDGAVLVRELLNTETRFMTTSTVSRGGVIEGIFIMVKDSQNRFADHSLWGNGWGWALFDPEGMLKTKNHKAECLCCHMPAKYTERVYSEGYPLLH